MTKRYIRVALRYIWRQKKYTFINILGLSLGIMLSLLAWLFVNHELSYDSFHEKSNSIYRVVSDPPEEILDGFDKLALTPAALGPTLVESYPEIVNSVRMRSFELIVQVNTKSFREKALIAEDSFFEVFSFTVANGNREQALDNPNSIVLNKKMAKKYFGNKNPVGETINVQLAGEFRSFIVSAVTENPPNNSSIYFDFLIPYQWLINFHEGWDTGWVGYPTYNYVELAKGVSPKDLEEKFTPIVEQHIGDQLESRGHTRDALEYLLQPITDLHLNTDVKHFPSIEAEGPPPSNIMYSFILISIALIVLIIASINYVSFSIGQSFKRAREVGVRKSLGASRKNLIFQFWGETLVLTFIALIAGIILYSLFLPAFNSIMDKQMSLQFWMDPINIIGFALIWILLSLLAGIYPSIVLSGFDPARVLKGTFVAKKKFLLSRFLVGVQFAATALLIISVLVISRQLDFMQENTFELKEDQIILIKNQRSSGRSLSDSYQLFKDLAHNNGIEYITGSYGTVGDNHHWARFSPISSDKDLEVRSVGVDYNYLDVYDHNLISGRFYNEEIASDSISALVVNETFVKQFGLEEPIGTVMEFTGGGFDQFNNMEIIGIVEDFHFESLHTKVEPAVFMISRESYMNTRYISVKYDPGNTKTADLLGQLENIWNTVQPGLPFEYYFLDDQFEQLYKAERKWKNVVIYASAISIFIACMGLLGLTSLTINRRRKEIGIRKVLGATITNITILLGTDFFKPVLAALLLAVPITYYFLNEWLQNFAYRIELGIFPFILAILFIFSITLITISYITINAALANPVNSISQE